MTLALADFFGLAPQILLPVLLVFLRIGAVLMFMPAFGEMMVPMRVKLAAAIAFTLVVAPAVLPDLQASPALERPVLLLAGAEVITGLAIGLSLRLVIMALQVAATISAQSTSLSQLLGGASVDPQPAIGFILLLAALALAAELGLHVQAAILFMRSYELVGPGHVIGGSNLASWAVDAVSASFAFAFTLAAPFMAVSLLYNLALGVINRAMPQLMVAFVGAPAITMGALILLALTAPLMLWLWAELFSDRLRSPFAVR
ncbi:MAG: flagellar biosynthetic protein FliR [Silicimonas sp.]|nr:flagellar biosynthetic protein FliR [Silicimonas sp.]